MIKVFTKDYHLTMKVKKAFNGMPDKGNRIAFTSTGCFVEFFTKEVNSEI